MPKEDKYIGVEGLMDNFDNYTTLIINIGNRNYIPTYISQFFQELSSRTDGAFTVIDLSDINISDPENALIKLAFTLTVGAKAKKYRDYSDAIIDTSIIPFLIGCGFDIENIIYTTYIPENYRHLYDVKGLGVSIFSDELYPHVEQVLSEVLGISIDEMNEIAVTLNSRGSIDIENVLSYDNADKFDELMKKLEINYTLYA